MTRGISYREQDRFVLFARALQSVFTPWIPINRIVSVLKKIRAGFVNQFVRKFVFRHYQFLSRRYDSDRQYSFDLRKLPATGYRAQFHPSCYEITLVISWGTKLATHCSDSCELKRPHHTFISPVTKRIYCEEEKMKKATRAISFAILVVLAGFS